MSIKIETIQEPWHFLKWKGISKSERFVVTGKVTNIEKIVYDMGGDYGCSITIIDNDKVTTLQSRFKLLYAKMFLGENVKAILDGYTHEVKNIIMLDANQQSPVIGILAEDGDEKK
jgi:hypothetical protein